MSKRCRTDAFLDPADREAFVRDNAVPILADCEKKIARLRQQVKLLLSAKQSLRREIKRLQEMVVNLVDRVAKQSDALSRKAEK